MAFSGGCLCGAVRFSAEGNPDASYCHCEDCRRASGAPMALWVGFPGGKVAWHGELTSWHNGSVTRQNCGKCGSPLVYRDSTIPDGRIWLAGGAFDRAEELAPNRHAFWSSRLSWLDIADSHAKYDRFTVERKSGGGTEPGDARSCL